MLVEVSLVYPVWLNLAEMPWVRSSRTVGVPLHECLSRCRAVSWRSCEIAYPCACRIGRYSYFSLIVKSITPDATITLRLLAPWSR